jgi:hypothetical protein
MMDTLAAALLLAIIALGIGIVVVLGERRGGSKVGVPALVLVAAGIIGMVPGVLRLSETVRVVASVASSILSLGVIGVLVAYLTRSDTTRLGRPISRSGGCRA